MEYTRELARFCSELSFESLPAKVVDKAKLCVMDYVANVYGSLELEAVRRVADHYRAQACGDVSVLGCGFRTNVRDAAFVNGVTAEAIEAQDGVRFGGNHPCSAVMPAALSVGESTGSDGGSVLAAIVAGYEAADRVAAAVHPFHTLSGFLPTGTCGTFGAAVAASRLMGLDGEGLLNAMGNAGYVLPLSMAEDLMAGCTVKVVQGGQAALAGIVAAGLAAAGVTGHSRVLEGSELGGGFTQITLRGGAEPVLERVLDGMGERFTVMDVYFKPYTACRHTHGAAQATLELISEGGMGAPDVQSVLVRTYAIGNVAVGKGVPEGGTFVSAQFSTPYVVAACLLDGEMGPSQLTEARIADPEIVELAGRVSVEQDDELNAMYPDRTATRVEVLLRDGRRLERQVDIPAGDPRVPMGEAEISDKLRRFASLRAGRKAGELREACLRLEELGDIGELTRLV